MARKKRNRSGSGSKSSHIRKKKLRYKKSNRAKKREGTSKSQRRWEYSQQNVFRGFSSSHY